MSSSRRKFVVRHPVVVDIGCSCRRPKISSFFTSSTYLSKPKPPNSPEPFSSTDTATTTSTSNSTFSFSHWESSLTATTSSPSQPQSPKTSSKGRRKKGRVGESVPVVKDSEDPYLDFRDSMLVMIVEKEIYAWEDLRDLLHRFLALNSPAHHHLILRAFAEIWASVFSTSGPSPSPSPSPRPSPRPSRCAARR